VAALSEENTTYEDEKRLEASTTRSHNNDELFDVNRYDDKTTAIAKRTEQRERERPSPSRRKPVKDDDENKDKFQVKHPTMNDILCGQSRVCASHEGNRHFQAVLDRFARKYEKATSKQEKMTMTKEIVAIIHNQGGKFLKNKDGMWEEISTVAARDKVSHALRTKVASWKRQEQQRLQQSRIAKGSSNTKKSKHRKGSRRSSAPATSKPFSDISPGTSFDGSDSTASESKVSDMLRYQQQVFENLRSPPRQNTTTTDTIDNEPLPFCPRRSTSFF